MADYFYLDPDYENFVLGQTKLKFSTLFAMSIYEFVLGMILSVTFIIPVAVWLSVSFAQEIHLQYRYYTIGLNNTVTVTDCKIDDWGNRGKAPRISYIYQVNSVDYKDDYQVPRTDINCEAFPIGQALKAKYLPQEPWLLRITEASANATGWDTTFNYLLIVGMILFFGFGVVYFVMTLINYFIAKLHHSHLSKNSTLLDGQIINAKSAIRDKPGYYYLDVTFTFQAPNGQNLKRKQSNKREDLRGKPLPEIGTPVRILYADDNAYVML
jgi:hypothetical protein